MKIQLQKPMRLYSYEVFQSEVLPTPAGGDRSTRESDSPKSVNHLQVLSSALCLSDSVAVVAVASSAFPTFNYPQFLDIGYSGCALQYAC